MKRIIVFFTVFMGLIFLAHEWIYPAWIKDIEPKKEEKKEEPPPAEQPVEEPKEEPKEEKKGTMPSSVEFISVVKEAEGKVKINWEPPLGTEIMALIYRDTQMMNTKDKIAQDKYINSVDTGAGEFIDQPDASGKYFYAIITVKGEVTNYFLIEDQNYNTIPVDIVAKQIPVKIKLAAPITRIKAELGEDSKSIKLIW
ncbi:MAG: hypothetical protein JW827_04980, partial [Spirochaetes bacterium]|nr:hypothetical protein [Spirochaetota bacterium]